MFTKFRWSWTGAATLFLALSIGIGFAAGFIISALLPSPISEAGINMLDSLGSGIIAVIGMAVGARLGATKHTDQT